LFNLRLKKYRNKFHFKIKEIAPKLELSESYYSLIESGKRKPSKKFIEKLVSISELPEEYWLYGINKEEYLDASHDFKNLRKTLDTFIELGSFKAINELFDLNNNPKDSLGKLVIAALKSDMGCIIEKKK